MINKILKNLTRISLLSVIPIQRYVSEQRINSIHQQVSEANRMNINQLNIKGNMDSYFSIHLDQNVLQQYLLDKDTLSIQLKHCVKVWQENNVKAIWIKLSNEQLTLAQTIQDCGFQMHHCTNEYLLFSQWLIQGEESRLPHYTTHYIGAGGLIVNEKNEFLVVKEKNGLREGFWGIPGGLVNDGEMITEAAVREVKEETNLDVTEAVDMILFREMLGFKWNKSDLYFVILLKLKNQEQQIKICEKELTQYKWVNLNDIEEVNQFFTQHKAGPTSIELMKIVKEFNQRKISIDRGFFKINTGSKVFYGQNKKFSLFRPNL